jgi:hypothetical protein
MKLICEHTDEVQYLTERNADGSQSVYIEGVFMQAEKENRNKRIYPRKILNEAVNRYIQEQVSTGRAVGELNHPDGPTINLDKVSHRITDLNWDGNNVVGKAQVLNTPMGKIVSGLIEGGVRLGVSSRGMGSIEEKNGKTYVKNDFSLATIDIVQDPSAQDAFVNGIMEGKEFVVTEDGKIEEQIDDIRKEIHQASKAQLAEAQTQAFEKFLSILKNGEVI